MKALIADPSHTVQFVLQGLFRQMHFGTALVTSGQQLLALLQTEPFDVICTSRYLDDMNCIELARRLAESPNTRHLPLLLLTSAEEPDLRLNAVTAGVTEIFKFSELHKLKHHLQSLSRQLNRQLASSGRLLLVEDSALISDILAAALTRAGHTVDRHSFAESALEAFLAHDYDLVLTDVFLEGLMSGIGLTHAIRQQPGAKGRTPVLAISGIENVSQKIELLRGGANDYINKPIVEEELIVRVNNLIDHKRLLDKTEAQQLNMERLVTVDLVTSLHNRRFLLEVGQKYVSSARRQQQALSVAFLDIDHFRRINDLGGNDNGDAVLAACARALRGACREEDITARYGGDEFVVVLADCDAGQAVTKAETLCRLMARLRPNDTPITASIGVASLPLRQTCRFDRLLENAENAKNDAKRAGRNRVVLWPLASPEEIR